MKADTVGAQLKMAITGALMHTKHLKQCRVSVMHATLGEIFILKTYKKKMCML